MHKLLRRQLGPYFSNKAIDAYLPAITSICDNTITGWLQRTASAQSAGSIVITNGADPFGGLPRAGKDVRLLTFDVISRLVLGLELSDGEMRSLSAQFEELTKGIFARPAINLPFTSKMLRYKKHYCGHV